MNNGCFFLAISRNSALRLQSPSIWRNGWFKCMVMPWKQGNTLHNVRGRPIEWEITKHNLPPSAKQNNCPLKVIIFNLQIVEFWLTNTCLDLLKCCNIFPFEFGGWAKFLYHNCLQNVLWALQSLNKSMSRKIIWIWRKLWRIGFTCSRMHIQCFMFFDSCYVWPWFWLLVATYICNMN